MRGRDRWIQRCVCAANLVASSSLLRKAIAKEFEVTRALKVALPSSTKSAKQSCRRPTLFAASTGALVDGKTRWDHDPITEATSATNEAIRARWRGWIQLWRCFGCCGCRASPEQRHTALVLFWWGRVVDSRWRHQVSLRRRHKHSRMRHQLRATQMAIVKWPLGWHIYLVVNHSCSRPSV